MALCSRCTYPSIHFFVSRSRSVVDCACVQAFTFLLTKTLSRSRSVVDCAHIRAFATKNSEDHGRLPDKHISKHSPSPGAGTLKITVGCPLCTNPSIRNKNLHTCWTPWSKRETRGLWARPPVLSPVPSQAVHSRACLNLHHSDIQGTAQKSPCVNTLFQATEKKKQGLSLSGCLGRTPTDTTTERHDTKAQIGAKGPPDKRKKKERGLLITGIFPARNLFLLQFFTKFQKNRRRVKLQSLQFYINSKTIGL